MTTLYWTSLAFGNIKVNIEYYYYSNAPFDLPHHLLCSVLLPVCSYCYIVCCMFFHRELTSKARSIYWCCFNSCWINTIATGLQQQGIMLWYLPIFSEAPHQVHRSLISKVSLLQVHLSLIASVPSSSAPFTNLQCVLLQVHRSLISIVRFYKSTIHQSPVLRISHVLRRSPLLRFYKCCAIQRSPVLHFLRVLHKSSLLRFYSCAVLQCRSICWLLFCAMWLCYSTILYRCEYAVAHKVD